MNLLAEFTESYEQSLNEIPSPKILFDILNTLNPSEIVVYIHRYCQPGTDCYKKMETIAFGDSDEAAYAYICFALITSDITKLETGTLGNLCGFLKTMHPNSSFNETLPWIYTLLHVLDDKILLNQCLQSINKTTPCYMNYSGLDFSPLKVLENVRLSNSTCRSTSFKHLILLHCEFLTTNLSAAKLRGVTVDDCCFLNVICERTKFLKYADVADVDKALISAGRLYQFLSRSKGGDAIKHAMQENLLTLVTENKNVDFKESIMRALFKHPLFAEHRSNISSSVNTMLSFFKCNTIKTKGQKILKNTNTTAIHEEVYHESTDTLCTYEDMNYESKDFDADADEIYNMLHNPDNPFGNTRLDENGRVINDIPIKVEEIIWKI